MIKSEGFKNWDFKELYGGVNEILLRSFDLLVLFLNLYQAWLRQTNNKGPAG